MLKLTNHHAISWPNLSYQSQVYETWGLTFSQADYRLQITANFNIKPRWFENLIKWLITIFSNFYHIFLFLQSTPIKSIPPTISCR